MSGRLRSRALLALSLTLVLACSPSTADDDNGGGDTFAGDADGTGGDTVGGGDHNSDDGPSGDAPGGDSAPPRCEPGAGGPSPVDGTRLEDIAIVWDEPVELCNVWQEGLDLGEELAGKVQIIIPPQDRPNLAALERGEVGLSHAVVAHSPFAAGRRATTDCQAPTQIAVPQFSDDATATALVVAFAYDFAALGRLTEEVSVRRQEGDTTALDYQPHALVASEVSWRYETAAGVSVQVGPCDGGGGLYDSVWSVTAFDGGEWVTVLRNVRTLDLDAGSFPVFTQGSQVFFSNRPYLQFESGDFWAQTYAASHHNWNEESLIDFTRDRISYNNVFKPGAWGAPITSEALKQVHLISIRRQSGAPAQIQATWVNPADGSETVEIYDLGATWEELNWKRVGNDDLTRSQSSCPDPQVWTAGWLSLGHVVRFLICPSAAPAGFDLMTAVAVVFPHDASQNGLAASAVAAVTVQGNPGYVASVGSSEVEIVRSTAAGFDVRVRDGGGSAVFDEVWSEELLRVNGVGFVPDPPELVRGANAAGDVWAEQKLLFGGLGGGQTTVWAPVYFRLHFAGQTHYVDAYDRLDYTFTHHNDVDSLVAQTDTLRLHWRKGWDGVPKQWVHAETLAGVEVLAETELVPQ